MNCFRAPFQLPELLDHIIDFLGDDRSALKASYLVSDTWSISAARHLFSSLRLDPEHPRYIIRTTNNDYGGYDAAAFECDYAWLMTRPRIVDHVQSIYFFHRLSTGIYATACVHFQHSGNISSAAPSKDLRTRA